MHGLINRSVQGFVRDTYGAATWAHVAREARLGFDSFEPLLAYDPALTEAVLTAAAKILNRPRDGMLEDLGTYLVSHPNTEALRRLLRFGGVTFDDFLHSLEDLPERARLALPDLDLPGLGLVDQGSGDYRLHISDARFAGTGHVLLGLLRAMADDYGALVLLDRICDDPADEVISIQLLDHRHSSGRQFDLAGWAMS
ncbi:MAG: heme NO-binding domain-containing protein [Rhodobacteraceae bacterium]|nr:heme NO-binding domain-containing protein [Paracoccaceae bacterium]